MSFVAAGIAGGVGLLKLGTGIVQNNKAASIEKNNPYPTYSVDPSYQQNVNTAQNMAQTGIPQTSYNNQLNGINQNQAGAVNAFNNSTGNSSLASIVRQGDAAVGNLNTQDAMARNRNMLNLLRERQTLAQQREKAWDWNSQQKYLGSLARSQALRGSGNANINGALNDFAGGATTIAAGGGFDGDGGRSANPNGVGATVQGGSYIAPAPYIPATYPRNSFYGNYTDNNPDM